MTLPPDFPGQLIDDRKVPSFHLDRSGGVRIDHYDEGAPFSSFLPGIGGRRGIPLWCMYVNRGQCVVSFGAKDKDHAIAEFLPATWAYQLVGVQGFRTFCLVDEVFFEPFQRNPLTRNTDYERSLQIHPDSIRIEEINQTQALQFKVHYFTIPNQMISGLVRSVEIINRRPTSIQITLLDGLPIILPAGFGDYEIKKMRRIHEAYASAELLHHFAAFYSPRVRVHDEAEVNRVNEGNFFASWTEEGGRLRPIHPVVDPNLVFGEGSDLVTPHRFLEEGIPLPESQIWENRLPCAFASFQGVLEPGASIRLFEIFGAAPDSAAVSRFLKRVRSQSDIESLEGDNRKLISKIIEPAFSHCSQPTLSAYIRQNFLDNILRGGVPELLPTRSGRRPLYLYSRRHGDLERDYNDFHVPAEPLSSGVGNFRDVLQNRRHNVWLKPELEDSEIRMFLSLIQADGYNPLAVEGYHWFVPEDVDLNDLCPPAAESARDELKRILGQPFTPGRLLSWAQANEVSAEDSWCWLKEVLEKCDARLVAQGHAGGHWIDHWTYLTDLLESFAAIWPDRVESMLTGQENIGWYWDGAVVEPRSEKFLLKPQGPSQLHSVRDVNWVPRELPPVTPFAKLCALCAVKSLSLDSQGIGMEMEAGRPGWNDSLNGLPALFGSSTCETAELNRLARWLKKHLPHPPDATFPREVADLIRAAAEILEGPSYDWHKASSTREFYRQSVYSGASGETVTLAGAVLRDFLSSLETFTDGALSKATDPETGLVNTYYMGEPIDFTVQRDPEGNPRLHSKGQEPLVTINSFHHRPLPLFLEGQVHLLRTKQGETDPLRVYQSVRGSGLFDSKLEMYKLNESLEDCPPTIGRARTFTRGWFENESIWPHMSYKYLLELLRRGLVEEFFTDAETMLVPFLDPDIYGRSILENSSFIASSACPDKNLHGRGFVARLSGATAEFIHIWNILTVGEQPFRFLDGRLSLALSPKLPAGWFTEDACSIQWKGMEIKIPENALAGAFLGDILLVYVNDARKNTYGPSAVHPTHIACDSGKPVSFEELLPEQVERIRRREFAVMTVWLN